MSDRRRVFSAEFKADAVRRCSEAGRPLTQVARELNIHPSLLQTWRRKSKPIAAKPRTQGNSASVDDELRRLRRENAELREDRDIKKSRGVLCKALSVRYAFIEEQRTIHCVRRMCDNLDVSRAGFYEWRKRPASARGIADAKLTATILESHEKSHGRYGRPRIHADLRALGVQVGAKRVARLMKAAQIEGLRPRRFRKTTDSVHAFPIAKNVLERNFDVTKIEGPNRVWAGDITYLATREGWLYLAVVLDLATRKVVGWSIDATMERSLVINALRAALASRRPAHGLLFHSDRGSQYASGDYRGLLDEYDITASMSGKGDCWDNAVIESFFGGMKRELGDPIWETRQAARAAIFEYIEIWYNRMRRHSTLGYLTPEQYELSLQTAA